MADPRADMAALRGIGVRPPARPPAAGSEAPEAPTPATTSAPPAASAAAQRRRPKAGTASSRRSPTELAAPVGPPAAQDRRSRHTTVYLEAPARDRLEEGLEADRDATVADVMLGAVRTAIGELRKGRPAAHPTAADDPIPPPPRRRRRRRVEDGRAVAVRFSLAEREALDRLGEELDMSLSGLISAALVLPTGPSAKRPSRRAGS